MYFQWIACLVFTQPSGRINKVHTLGRVYVLRIVGAFDVSVAGVGEPRHTGENCVLNCVCSHRDLC